MNLLLQHFATLFIKLKKLKENHNHNNLINEHYDIWMTTFWSLQTGDIVPIETIKDEGSSSIFHKIFKGANTDEIENFLNNIKDTYRKNNKKAYIPTSIKYRVNHQRWTRWPSASGKQIKTKKIKIYELKVKKVKKIKKTFNNLFLRD